MFVPGSETSDRWNPEEEGDSDDKGVFWKRLALLGGFGAAVTAVALAGTTEVLKLTEGSQIRYGIKMPNSFIESPASRSGDRVFVGPLESIGQVDCGGTRFVPKGLAALVISADQYQAAVRSVQVLPDGVAEVHCAASMSQSVSWLPRG